MFNFPTLGLFAPRIVKPVTLMHSHQLKVLTDISMFLRLLVVIKKIVQSPGS